MRRAVNPALGLAIKALREKRGMTQEQVAYGAGLSVGTLSRIERGKSDPLWSTVERIAEVLGVGLEEVVEEMPAWNGPES